MSKFDAFAEDRENFGRDDEATDLSKSASPSEPRPELTIPERDQLRRTIEGEIVNEWADMDRTGWTWEHWLHVKLVAALYEIRLRQKLHGDPLNAEAFARFSQLAEPRRDEREAGGILTQNNILLWDLQWNISDENGHKVELLARIEEQRKANGKHAKSEPQQGETLIAKFLHIINTTALPGVLNTERVRICYRKALQEWASQPQPSAGQTEGKP